MTDPKATIVAAAEAASSRILAKPVRALGFTATCDMTYLVNDARIPTVILGPGSIDVAHQANEYIALEQMEKAVALYLSTVEAWVKGDTSER